MDVRKLIDRKLERDGSVGATEIASQTGLSRTYVNRIFQQLRREGKIRLVGKANRARYVFANSEQYREAIEVERSYHRILRNIGLEEDVVLEEIRKETGIFIDLSKNVRSIVDYSFTEILNNAIEHSRSERITVRMTREDKGIAFTVEDRGIGIFRNIMGTRHLASEREAIQDLLKGKQTTAPERHSGEGIFFTSKAADALEIRSSGNKLLFDNRLHDIFVRDLKPRIGTRVDFWISRDSTRELSTIFREFTGDELTFDSTSVAVRLYSVSPGLVSRSQARRVLSGLDKFQHVTLDFQDVNDVGQGFIDEVFRVWKRNNPDKTIKVVNASDEVNFMINRLGK